MSKCSICKYSTNNKGLCERPVRIFGGIGCDYFSIREPQVCVDNICIICGKINDQEYKGYQYCSKCEQALERRDDEWPIK